jgi:hypothetical protein
VKTRNSSALLRYREFAPRKRAVKKFFRVELRRTTRGDYAAATGARRLHTKLSGVTVIFFLL